MGTPRIEVGDVLVQHPLEVVLVNDEQMIQTFAPGRSDPALGERVRPRRPHRCPQLSYPESSQARANASPYRLSRSRMRYRGGSRSQPKASTTCWAARSA